MPLSESDKPALIWLNFLVFTLTFAVAAIGVPLYAFLVGFEASTIIATIIAIGFCGFSITAGYHRLWSHKAYQANVVVRFIFAIGGAFSLQNSILHWSSDHRTHHRFVDDNEKDPYSAKRGFWYSHMGWMLREYQPDNYYDYKNVKDLQRDKIVMWQHNNYLVLALLTNLGIPALFGLITGQFWASILLVGFLRLVVSHHVTFLINSLAHMWGKQPYNDQNTAKDNALVALLTYGEGYHNYHHAFAFDYRNAIKWWQFDPTKWLIKGMSWVGLATNLRKTSDERISQAIAKLQRNKTCEKLIDLNLPNKEEALLLIHQEYDELLHAMNTFYAGKKHWLEVTKDKLIDNVEKSKQAQQYRELKQRWSEQQAHWHVLIHQYA